MVAQPAIWWHSRLYGGTAGYMVDGTAGYMVVTHEILVSAQGPLVLGFGVLGLRVWGQGLTILSLGVKFLMPNPSQNTKYQELMQRIEAIHMILYHLLSTAIEFTD